jgi:GDPmannose 4,6-dehydratase
MNKCAVVTGATGQDGSYLVELLLEKDYTVVGIVRRTTYDIKKSNLTEASLNHPKLKIFDGDLTDQASLVKVFNYCKKFDNIEVYNLAAQSHVGISFKCPVSTSEINYIGTLNLLETIKQLDLVEKTKFYQASTSEMFGKVQEVPQTESTPFYPRSPYGVSKVAAHWIVKNYRESYGLFACCGILFNHESPRRGNNFVTQKIVKGLARVMSDQQEYLELGNIEAKRDWGHAKDYVRAMWMMLQQENPDDYIVSSGKQHSVRNFIECVLKTYDFKIKWVGEGIDEQGVIGDKTIIKISEGFYRPAEVDSLVGNPAKIESIGWKPEFTFDDLVKNMVGNEARAIKKLYL